MSGFLHEVDYWLFGARRARSQPLYALVEGAEGAQALAADLARAGRPGGVTRLDPSATLRDAPYDFIACDLRPHAGHNLILADLAGLLAPGGGMRITVAAASCDVPGLFGLLDRAGLQAASLIPPLLYDPDAFQPDPGPYSCLPTVPDRMRAAVGESLAGDVPAHVVYARRAGDDIGWADPMDRAAVPILRDGSGVELVRRIRLEDDRLPVTLGTRIVALKVPPQTRGLVPLLDGARTVADLVAIMVSRGVPAERFDAIWRTMFATLSGLNQVLLQAPP
ncbi:hypothetical protein [Gluconacetobacter diazotrophicus]|uniref:Methyltransferase n=1 Tax=Gluconacetobacter diazotrophicus (strain ATCC 49037 / DSM 5601 / CCUG 37298 / CIP 103539 / LMG 7603 / PAl5) TaxID=272568 RepID=A9HRE3_GLUDA|nr:hypothetical protein [Gluconacetobacter diazotrophicus]CAP56889.1 conserved hypothetical protein [Gluconacetobacter diazotrophicus PA1 5]